MYLDTHSGDHISGLYLKLNNQDGLLILFNNKKEKLKLLCTKALDIDILSIRFVARVIGKIVSSLPETEFGKLHYRNLERDVFKTDASDTGWNISCSSHDSWKSQGLSMEPRKRCSPY